MTRRSLCSEFSLREIERATLPSLKMIFNNTIAGLFFAKEKKRLFFCTKTKEKSITFFFHFHEGCFGKNGVKTILLIKILPLCDCSHEYQTFFSLSATQRLAVIQINSRSIRSLVRVENRRRIQSSPKISTLRGKQCLNESLSW